MSVALESARLFEQTQKLLAQTEQRASELATVNALGQALNSKIELAELIRTLGEKIRETFRADIVYVALLDEAAGLIHFPYAHGEELAAPAPRQRHHRQDHRDRPGPADQRGRRRGRSRPSAPSSWARRPPATWAFPSACAATPSA
jgi:GAF domain-containing protein